MLRLLELDPSKRLGFGLATEPNGYETLKSHPYFAGIDWDKISDPSLPCPIDFEPIFDTLNALKKKQNDDIFNDEDSAEIKGIENEEDVQEIMISHKELKRGELKKKNQWFRN